MAHVMSPDAPQFEEMGLKAAFRYYDLMRHYTRCKVIESAEKLQQHWNQRKPVKWSEFASGFMAGALIVARTRSNETGIEQLRLF